jgi:hypothetical protein
MPEATTVEVAQAARAAPSAKRPAGAPDLFLDALGLQLHAISPANAAALVVAGLLSVIIFPIISLQLLRSSAKGPSMVPEQAYVR